MAKLLLNLRNVPDDEAEDVRALLEEHRIAFYETRPSLWGISAGGIWVKQNADAERAARLMSEYQSARQARARAVYEAARREGTAMTLWTVAREHPLRVLATLTGILLLLGLTALPFLFLLRT